MSDSLLEIAISDLPPVFVRKFTESMSKIYMLAKLKAQNDHDYDEAEQRYIIPHIRRVLTEKAFRDAALDAGINAQVNRTASGAHEYSIIQTGRISLTVSYVEDFRRPPRPSKHRSQFSEINQHLTQLMLDFEPSKDQKITTAGNGEIYGILIHGPESGNDEGPGFLKIGFPSQNCQTWKEYIDLYEVLEKQVMRYQKRDEDYQAQIQPVEPALKQINHAEEDE